MKCPKCKFDGNPNLEEVKMHTKATCPDCGAYIKMVGRKERDAIIEETNRRWVKSEPEIVDPHKEKTLTVCTVAPDAYLPDILTRVKKSLSSGFTSGEGSIEKPFDEHPYHYDFEYK